MDGYADPVASGMSDTGLVGGVTSADVRRAFVWREGEVRALGTLGGADSWAHGVNDRGHVVGSARTTDGSPHAALWQGGAITDLGTLGGASSVATHINELGQVVGVSDVAEGGQDGRAFLWQSGEMTDLGTLGGAASRATSLNDQGQVVGRTQTESGAWQAFLWQNGSMRALDPLETYPGSGAMSVNNAGQVVGYAESEAGFEGPSRAVLWDGGTPIDLGSLGGDRAIAYGINEAGQVVGRSQDESGNDHAFVWHEGEMIDLNTLVDPTLGWRLTDALAINDAGQITGHGVLHGEERSFLLRLPGSGEARAIGVH